MALILPTNDEVTAIHNGERETINNFYKKNLEDFKRICFCYCRARNVLDLFNDCINQVYVDLSFYNFSTEKTFYFCIKRSCTLASMFSSRVFSLDSPINEDGDTFGELMASKAPSALEEIEYNETLQETAPAIFRTLTDVLKGSSINKSFKKEISELFGYLYPTFTDEEIKILAGV